MRICGRVRWFYQTPEREAAGRPARAAPSVVALLSALRNAMAGTGGDRLRVERDLGWVHGWFT